jgi:hypothetical protein
MTKESIEGSAARAADRGRDQLFGDALPDHALNSLTAVEAVVRSFAEKVADVRARYNADKITDAQARDEVEVLAQKYADMFMGKSSEYAALPWNTPEQLGAYLANVIEGGTAPETAARDFLLYVAAQLLQIMVEHEDAKIDDEVAQFRLGALIEDAVHAFLGLPNIEMPEDDS